MRMSAGIGLLAALLVLPYGVLAVAPPSEDRSPDRSTGSVNDADLAAQFYSSGNFVAAAPIYERLVASHPDNAVYDERLAFSLAASTSLMPPGPERDDATARVRSLVDKARALGDDSNLLKIIDELMKPTPAGDASASDEVMRAAEQAFVSGDLDTALAGYRKVADSNPKSYEARLFAGDVCYKKDDEAQASYWFQEAIRINPNIETAYRYWGDLLMRFGHTEAAREKFVDAVVAWPYEQRAWVGLSQWAERSGAELHAPAIHLPPAPTVITGKSGKQEVTITVDAEGLKHPESAGAWLIYSSSRALWRDKEFTKAFPEAKAYRHSLREEVESLQTMLAFLKEQPLPKGASDKSLEALQQLDKDGMLACWVLINDADEGIAQDYADYRAKNRQLLHDYLVRYLIHPRTEH